MLVNTQNWMGIVGHKAIEFLFVHKLNVFSILSLKFMVCPLHLEIV